MSCPFRTLLHVYYRPNAMHWAEINQAFSLNINFQPLIRIINMKITIFKPKASGHRLRRVACATTIAKGGMRSALAEKSILIFNWYNLLLSPFQGND